MGLIAATLDVGIYKPLVAVPIQTYGTLATPVSYLCLESDDCFNLSAGDQAVTGGLASIVYKDLANAAPVPASFVGSHSDALARNVQIPYLVHRLHDANVNWRNINTSNGVYSWSTLDALVTQLLAEGKTIVYTICAAPDWAVTAGAVGGAAYGGKANMNPDAGTLSTFVTALAARYAGKIAYYETWNEAQDTRYWAGTAAQLASLHRQAYLAIKAADAAAKVLSPSTTGWHSGGPASAYMASFFGASDGAAGTGKDWCADGVAMHSYNPYPNQGDFGLVHSRHAACRATMTTATLAATVPIMDTEWGFNGVLPGIVTWSWRSLPKATRRRLLAQQFIGMWAAQKSGSAPVTFSCFYRESGAMGWASGDTDVSDWTEIYNLLTTDPILQVNALNFTRQYAVKFASGKREIF